MRDLERENKILRRLVSDYAAICKELMEAMPEEIREQEHTQRLIKQSGKIIWYLQELDKKDSEYAASLPTSGQSH